ncbi:hypothetical protein M135_2642 [Bacteroides fragilis str. S36L5]|nr:hypothetical protein M135_2642 [Bacteroides fragilis str. S36L5]
MVRKADGHAAFRIGRIFGVAILSQVRLYCYFRGYHKLMFLFLLVS